MSPAGGRGPLIIDDFRSPARVSALGTRWRAVSDRVMGGVSQPHLQYTCLDGRHCLRLRGEVRLDNNGGFLQAVLDLAAGGGAFDASAYGAIALLVQGNGERYGVHLRSTELDRPWQSYRAGFVAAAGWQRVVLPFTAFAAHRTALPLDRARLRRIGIAAIGRAFTADVAVAELALLHGRG